MKNKSNLYTKLLQLYGCRKGSLRSWYYERVDSSAIFFVASPGETHDHPKSQKHGGVVQSSAYLPLVHSIKLLLLLNHSKG